VVVVWAEANLALSGIWRYRAKFDTIQAISASHKSISMVSRSPISLQAVQTKTPPPRSIKKGRRLILGIATCLLCVTLITLLITPYVTSHVPWRVTIDGQSISGKATNDLLNELPNQPVVYSLKINTPNQTYTLDSTTIDFYQDFQRINDTISATLNHPLDAWRWWGLSLTNPTSFRTPLVATDSQLEAAVAQIAQAELLPGKPPSLMLNKSGDVNSLKVDAGENGYELDGSVALAVIQNALADRAVLVEVPLQTSVVALTTEQVETLTKRGQSLVGESLAFTIPDQPTQLTINDVMLISFLNPTGGNNQEAISNLTQDWSQKVDRPPQNPILDLNSETLKVDRFVPPLDGLVINQTQVQQLIERYLTQLINQAEVVELAKVADNQAEADKATTDPDRIDAIQQLPLAVQPPSMSLADTNELGINEKIGHGQSRYAGSIATRIHNISLATSRVNLIILKPGQEFRFNDQLGDVSAATGFKPAYIIRSGRTELGDGGGVCQVSTTVFRAALDAGLQITKRLPHSYRVSYYELDTKPGIDATVFSGEVDLRFVNDTPGHILIYGQADPKTLTMYYDFYGTNDGRVATISDHVTWAATPPLPPEYIYDPSLAPGQRKQIDWSAPGLKAKFTYTVVDGVGQEKHKQTFTSNYRPWSAKYLVGTPPESS